MIEAERTQTKSRTAIWMKYQAGPARIMIRNTMISCSVRSKTTQSPDLTANKGDEEASGRCFRDGHPANCPGKP